VNDSVFVGAFPEIETRREKVWGVESAADLRVSVFEKMQRLQAFQCVGCSDRAGRKQQPVVAVVLKMGH
jgi:hypothetical protein